MSGNVYEWCQDWFAPDYYIKSDGLKNPVNKIEKNTRVVRGGSWSVSPDYCRSFDRSLSKPNKTNGHLGFRILKEAKH